jgi:hypothetical protein
VDQDELFLMGPADRKIYSPMMEIDPVSEAVFGET